MSLKTSDYRDARIEKAARAMQAASRPDVDPDKLTPGPRGTVGLMPAWRLYAHMAAAAVDALSRQSARLSMTNQRNAGESVEVTQADIDMANDYLSSALRCTATLAERFARHRLASLPAAPENPNSELKNPILPAATEQGPGNNRFRDYLAASIKAARFTPDALDPKVAEILETVLARYDASHGLAGDHDKEEGSAMWRNGITNTVALVDAVRKKHRHKAGNKAMAAFDADLNAALTAWFDHTRGAKPDTYVDAEREWLQFRTLSTKAGTA